MVGSGVRSPGVGYSDAVGTASDVLRRGGSRIGAQVRGAEIGRAEQIFYDICLVLLDFFVHLRPQIVVLSILLWEFRRQNERDVNTKKQ